MKILTLKKQLGISLVEIMVAMVISIFLLGGVIQVYIGNKTSYSFADSSSRIQENARFALDTMTSDLRMAGFWGCAQHLWPQGALVTTKMIEDENPHLVNQLKFNATQAPLYDYIINPAISGTVNTGLNGSDSITVLGSKAGQNIIQVDMTSYQSDIVVNSSTNIGAKDIVIVSNCDGADIFEATSVVGGGGLINISHKVAGGILNNKSSSLSQIYTTTAAVSALQAITYSIQTGASGEPALWRSLNGNDEELIEGIEQMEILYGIDNSGDGQANQYVSANNVANSRSITAVRVFLVVRSDTDGITDSAQSYRVNGVATIAPDNRLRQVFSITITLRNRT